MRGLLLLKLAWLVMDEHVNPDVDVDIQNVPQNF